MDALPGSLRGDIADLQGCTTGEGIHRGGTRAPWPARPTSSSADRPDWRPAPPRLRLGSVSAPELSAYGFSLHYQEHWGGWLRLEHGRLEMTVPPGDTRRLPRPD